MTIIDHSCNEAYPSAQDRKNMSEAFIITDKKEIAKQIPRCIELAHKVEANIPFHYMHLPLQWWRHFNNTDGTIFGKKRGKNFLGLQSQLQKFYLITVEDNDLLYGAIPLVSYTLKTPDQEGNYRMLAFAGDYITATCQDFLVLPERRYEIIKIILSKLIDSFSLTHDLLAFGYIPDFSENIPCIRQYLSETHNNNISYQEMTTARRGGVWPWTIVSLRSACKNISSKIDKNHIIFQNLHSLSEKLENCTRMSLLFPKNRTDILDAFSTIMPNISNDKNLEQEFETIKYCLNSATITYPYIDLLPDRESYWQSLSKSKRYYFRRYLKRFQESGGGFQKIVGSIVTEKDIGDCIRLHLLRWGKNSAAVCGVADAFHRDLGMAMAKEDMFTIFFATLNGKRIAAHTCFDINHRREFYLPGRNPKHDDTRAGSLLVMETILDAIDHGFKIYDLGVVGFPYKMDFTKKFYRTRNFFIYKKGFQPDLNKIFNGFECMK